MFSISGGIPVVGGFLLDFQRTFVGRRKSYYGNMGIFFHASVFKGNSFEFKNLKHQGRCVLVNSKSENTIQ